MRSQKQHYQHQHQQLQQLQQHLWLLRSANSSEVSSSQRLWNQYPALHTRQWLSMQQTMMKTRMVGNFLNNRIRVSSSQTLLYFLFIHLFVCLIKQRRERADLLHVKFPDQVHFWANSETKTKIKIQWQRYICVNDMFLCWNRQLTELWSEHPGGDSTEEGTEGQHEESRILLTQCWWWAEIVNPLKHMTQFANLI